MASMLALFPQTPTHTRVVPPCDDHRPIKSSPLAPISSQPSSSPGPVSPVAEIQARRKGQYKSRAPSSTTVASLKYKGRYRKAPATPIPFILGPATPEAGQAAFLRERFKADCFERARRAREKGRARRRPSSSSDASSDGLDFDMITDGGEDEANDGSVFDDELFRRVVANEKRKRAHAYALSYEVDVGSSFDPDLEDPTEWEDLCRSPSSHSQRQQERLTPENEVSPPEDLEDLSDFDEFDLDEDTAWVDAYIASLPLDSAECQLPTSSGARHSEEQYQMDITMD